MGMFPGVMRGLAHVEARCSALYMVTLLHNCSLTILGIERLIVEVWKLPLDDIVHMNLVPDYKRVKLTTLL